MLVVPDDPAAYTLLQYELPPVGAADETLRATAVVPRPSREESEAREETERHRALFTCIGLEIVSRVAVGGQGILYQALHKIMDRLVALKLLRTDLAQDSQMLKRFLREARAAARLEHANLVKILNAGCLDGQFYIVFPWISGKDLGRICEEQGPIPAVRALVWTMEVAQGLHALHVAGVAHRDVKPSNMLLHGDGSACLTDLGMARVLDEGTITASEVILGTPCYLPPEQTTGAHEVTPASDVYSLGLRSSICSGARPNGTKRWNAGDARDTPHPDPLPCERSGWLFLPQEMRTTRKSCGGIA
ncbi:MAG: serine/threonine protein kinase [Planctomycetes bacterium]|nr:serine/threonine protein kinase [Planctomycetota bacterium]